MSGARRTALGSLAAAVALVALKLSVAFGTRSLGVLAEAAHSGVDAAGALLTFWAVTVAERPADPEHPYGHGKAQHLSALAEALFLAGVAVWIAVEAGIRLHSSSTPVHATRYAIAAMLVILAVDATRTAFSLREGRRSASPALLANAVHFASDFVGTLAVLAGLLLVAAGVPQADSVAAVFVAGLVLVAALRLAWRNADALMDRAPAGLGPRIEEAVGSLPGVSEVRAVRVREAGGQYFADVVIGVPRLEGLERSHATMSDVEDAVAEQVGRALVTVHAEPIAEHERANDRVAAAALRTPGVMEVHNVIVLEEGARRTITLHARVRAELTLGEAAPLLERLKAEIAAEIDAAEVFVHLEPFAPDAMHALDATASEPQLQRDVAAAVTAVAGGDPRVVLFRQGGRLLVIASIAEPDGESVLTGHRLAGRIEEEVRARVPAVADVIVEVTARDGA
jgi:cation diffusion facilitator family transporter